MSLRTSRWRAMAAALALEVLSTAGCSWLTVQRPPPGPIEATPPIECTSSKTSSVIDTVAAVLLGGVGVVTVVAGASAASSDSMFSGIGAGVAVIGAGLVATAVPLGFSAAYGYEKTSDCQRLKEAQVSCTSGVEESCRTLQERRP